MAKIKEGVFVGPDLKKLIEYSSLTHTFNHIEKLAWNAFINDKKTFLCNKKSTDFREKIKVILDYYHENGMQ